MHKVNDRVAYLHVGVALNALVVKTGLRLVEGQQEELLTVAYVDEKKGLQTAVGILRYKQGASQGWLDEATAAPGGEPGPSSPTPVDSAIKSPTLTDEQVHDLVKSKLYETHQIIPPEGSNLEQVFKAVNKIILENEPTSHTPANHETKQYEDGSSATGPGPLPEHSPEEQAAMEAGAGAAAPAQPDTEQK